MANIFPRGLALGKAFYDRVNERKKLKSNIEHTIHSVLIAPRRYGKTSLIAQVLYEHKVNHVWIDFMTITSKEDLQAKLLQKIGELVVEIVPTAEKLKKVLAKYFKKLKPELTFKVPGIHLALKLNQDEESNKEGITEALISLDRLAQEVNKRLVMVFDEFQEILRIDEESTLQGSIRHAVERSQNVTYLFSGSKHRPLRRMFNGKENPLYALCENIPLDKIAKEDYVAFINKAATKKWGKPLEDSIMEKILSYSDRYPKYINALCSALWVSGEKPTDKVVDELWLSYLFSKKTDITEELSDLTLNQRKLLQWLCLEPASELYSQKILQELRMPQSSLQKAVDVLLEKDFITEENGVYKVLDPIWGSYFKTF